MPTNRGTGQPRRATTSSDRAEAAGSWVLDGPVMPAATLRDAGEKLSTIKHDDSMNAVQGISYEKFNFPVGECHVRLRDTNFDFSPLLDLTFNYKRDGDIIELLLVADAIRQAGCFINSLNIPYVPFCRQDRVAVKGEAFSLGVFAALINSLNINRVRVMDPHSDVIAALIKNVEVVAQEDIFAHYMPSPGTFYLVSPDGGALKKIYKVAAKVNPLGVIECSKKRDLRTGTITGVRVNHEGSLVGKEFVIVDDICDGGRTFVEIAKALKDLGAKSITLMVTHGFFTKGLGVFDGLIDHIYTREGKLK